MQIRRSLPPTSIYIIEHGAKPAGSNPERSMPAFGDRKMLTPQQIADVIAYIISLNP